MAPGLDLPICVMPCRVARMNTRKDILPMPGNHADEYVGRHRKPEHDPKDPPTDTSLHRAYELGRAARDVRIQVKGVRTMDRGDLRKMATGPSVHCAIDVVAGYIRRCARGPG